MPAIRQVAELDFMLIFFPTFWRQLFFQFILIQRTRAVSRGLYVGRAAFAATIFGLIKQAGAAIKKSGDS
jgi:hypothetical protein